MSSASSSAPEEEGEDDYKELHLFTRYQGARMKDQPADMKSFAEMRLFRTTAEERTLGFRAQDDFDHLLIPDEVLEAAVSEATRRIRTEIGLTYDIPNGVFAEASALKHRLNLLGFRFQRFLNSLRKEEDTEYEALLRKQDQDLSLHGAEVRLGAESANSEEYKSVLEHVVKFGMEEHLKLVRTKIFGAREPLGVTVTLKDFNINLLKGKSEMSIGTKSHKELSEEANRDEDGHTVASVPQLDTLFTTVVFFFTCWCVSLYRACASCAKSNVFDRFPVLTDINLVLKPARMTLLLGPPHAGKTRLIHAIAGLEKPIKSTKEITGSIMFNGYETSHLSIPNFATVVEEIDNHLPTLTVKETLQFAHDCRGAHNPDQYVKRTHAEDPEFAKNFLSSRVDVILAVLGLSRAANTIIGNEVIKGVSGGEKRRVTLGEMLVVGAKVLLLDEISTGLDSAATFDITKSLSSVCKIMNSTVVVSLLMPAPETIRLFDDILLLSGGMVVYHGPVERVQEYFASLGYICPKNKDLGDFLQEMTNETDSLRFLMSEHRRRDRGIREPPPRTPAEFAARYKETEWYAETDKILKMRPEELHTDHDFEKVLLHSGRFKNSVFWLVFVVIKRQWTLVIRNKPFLIARLVQNLVLGLLEGALFWQIPFSEYYLFAMIYIQLAMFMGFSSLALITDIIMQRRIYYKQSKAAFFPAFVFVISEFIVALPFSVFDAIVLGSIVYFMTGMTLSDNGKHYFIFLVLCVSFGVMMSALVRFNSYSNKTRESASGVTVFFVVLMVLFSGGMATAGTIPPWFIWIYWLNPLSWIYRSMLQNQFLSSEYQGPTTNYNGQCVQYCSKPDLSATPPCPPPFPETTCGYFFLEARQFSTNEQFLWGGFGFCLMYTILFLLLSSCSLVYIRFDDIKPKIRKPRPKREKFELRVASPVSPAMPSSGTSPTIPASAASPTMPPSAAGPSPPLPPTVSGVPPTSGAATMATAMPSLSVPLDLERGISDSTRSPRKAAQPSHDEFKDAPPVRPASLAFRNIRYTIELPMESEETGKKEMMPVDLLKDVSGFARPCEMIALMGSSGAGKTTLLDVLSLRKTVGTVAGDIFVNGQPMLPRLFRRTIGYVEQFGVHSALTTVHEALEFSASLRLSNEYTSAQRKALVHLTEHILELESVRNHPIGTLSSLEGLSFEENKRLTIGVELVSNPSILFCDEPTSGLDARAATIVMDVLRRVASLGRTIICTIHQPSVAVFEQFDRLLLMKRGGEVVYFGELGQHSQNLINYFQRIPGVEPIPDNYNPATWMLEVIGAGVGRAASENQADFPHEYRESSLARENMALLESLLLNLGNRVGEGGEFGPYATPQMGGTMARTKSEAQKDDARRADEETFSKAKDEEKHVDKKFARSGSYQLRLLLLRNFQIYWRYPSYTLLRTTITTVFAVLMGGLFYNQTATNAAGIQSRISVISMLILLLGNYNLNTIIPFRFNDRALFYRERSSGMYSSAIYGLSIQFVEDPYLAFAVICAVVIFYFMVGLAMDAGLFFFYLFLAFLYVETMTFIGGFLATALPSPAVAALIASLFSQVSSLFAGVTVPGQNIPEWMLGLYYFVPMRWAQEGLISTQFEYNYDIVCIPNGIPVLYTDASTTPEYCAGTTLQPNAILNENTNVTTSACCPLGSCPMSARDYVLYGLDNPDVCSFVIPSFLGGENGYQYSFRWWDVLYVSFFLVMIRGVTLIMISKVSFQKR